MTRTYLNVESTIKWTLTSPIQVEYAKWWPKATIAHTKHHTLIKSRAAIKCVDENANDARKRKAERKNETWLTRKMLIRSDWKWITWCAVHRTQHTAKTLSFRSAEDRLRCFFLSFFFIALRLARPSLIYSNIVGCDGWFFFLLLQPFIVDDDVTSETEIFTKRARMCFMEMLESCA